MRLVRAQWHWHQLPVGPTLLCAVPWGTQLPPTPPPPKRCNPLISLSSLQGGYAAYRYAQPAAAAAAYSDR